MHNGKIENIPIKHTLVISIVFTLSPENSQNCIPITGNNFGGQSYGVGELSSDAPMVRCYSGSDSECMCVSLSQQSQKCLANIALLTLQQ